LLADLAIRRNQSTKKSLVNANGTVVLGPQNELLSAKTHVHKNESTIRPSPKPQTHNFFPTKFLTVIHHSKHKFVVAYDG